MEGRSVYAEHKVYWAPNVFNNLATVSVWAVWCVSKGQSHAASTLPVQQLSKQAVRLHMEGPLSLDPHWSGQAWKPPLSQSGGIWGTNATLRRRNLCDSGKQLTAHYASSALLLLFSLSPSLLLVSAVRSLFVELHELTIHRPLSYSTGQSCLWWTCVGQTGGWCWALSSFVP